MDNPNPLAYAAVCQLGKKLVPAANRQILVPLAEWWRDRNCWFELAVRTNEIHILNTGPLHRLPGVVRSRDILRYSRLGSFT